MPTKPPTHNPDTGASVHNPRGEVSEAKQIRNKNLWKRMSRWLRTAFPLCQSPWKCHHTGANAAESVHHIKPLATRPDLAHTAFNTVPVCNQCHRRLEDMERHGHATAYLFGSVGTKWKETVERALGGDANEKQQHGGDDDESMEVQSR